MYVYVETCEAAVDANLTNSRLNLHVCVCVCVCVCEHRSLQQSLACIGDDLMLQSIP